MRGRVLSPVVLAALAALACCAAPRDDAPASALGSDRGARVAIASDGTTPLVYLAAGRPPDLLAELARAAPNVQVVSGLNRETAIAHAAGAHGCDAELLSEELLANAPNLRWVQARSAGVERYQAFARLHDDTIVVTNMKGMHGPAIAEHAFAMLLQLTRQLRRFDAAAAAGRWARGEDGMQALAGRTMLVVGLGGIGSEIARRAKAFDMRVTATVRSEREAPDYVDVLVTSEELDALLPEADVVAICAPLTPETERLFDAGRFARMKRGALLINIARGKIVVTDALVAALDQRLLGGACLDVTDPEPLPAGHTLWGRENVVITPHVAAAGDVTDARTRALFVANMRRFARGEPLWNVVDMAAGY